ncbi:MAG: helix-turn-helix domain-containing protein [Pilosibacter sp.]
MSYFQYCSGYRAKTAEYPGISRRCLQYKIKEYPISSQCHYDES